MLQELPELGHLFGQRQLLIDDFTARMVSIGINRFAAAGMAATWWEDCFYELETAVNRGWKAVIEGWLITAEASQSGKNGPDLVDQTAIKLLAVTRLEERDSLIAEFGRRDAEIKSAESIDEDDDELERELSPTEIRALKSARAKVKKQIKTIDDSLLSAAGQVFGAMPPDEAFVRVSTVLCGRIEEIITDYIAETERSILSWYDNLIHKYGTPLFQILDERDSITDRLDKRFRRLGYG